MHGPQTRLVKGMWLEEYKIIDSVKVISVVVARLMNEQKHNQTNNNKKKYLRGHVPCQKRTSERK